jgi:hypothetical protein
MAVVAAGAVAGAGCDVNGNPMQVIARGGALAALTVTEGSTPTYAWTGARATSLAVRSAGGEVSWHVEALDLREGFASPVRHGVVPVGAREVAAARSLQPGVVHTATVVGVDGMVATRTFRPASLSSP